MVCSRRAPVRLRCEQGPATASSLASRLCSSSFIVQQRQLICNLDLLSLTFSSHVTH